MSQTIAIIPARGGSKRIPNKNIVDFCGKPLINYSVRCAEESGVFDKIHVSTDCDLIAEVVDKLGHGVDFMRPEFLADDFTPLMPVLKFVLESYADQGQVFSDAGLMLATCPLVEPSDVVEAYKLYSSCTPKLPLLSVSRYPVPVEWAFRLEKHNKLAPLQPDKLSVRSQDLEECYFDTGCFALFPGEFILGSTGAGDYTKYIGYELERYKGIDIDELEDLRFAEIIYRGLKLSSDEK